MCHERHCGVSFDHFVGATDERLGEAMPSALAVLKTEDHNHELAYGKTSPSSTLFFFDSPRETMECDWRI